MRSLALPLALLLALGGCASVAPPSRPAPTPAEQRAALPAELTIERQWLQSWFRGTPVRVGQRVDGAVTVDVPRAFCFEPGRSRVKPALAAVLDKVAESLRRRPLATVPLIAAPADPNGPGPLALQRANRVRQYLHARGVATARLGPPTDAAAAAVELRLEAAPS
jgi:outer membrane protein OmpA-like peptidoglycan-associated protein